MTKVLHLYGGWPGHYPEEVASWADGLFEELDFEVDKSRDIFVLDQDLSGYDLIVFGWNNALTTEDLSDSQEENLLSAVESGTGVAAWHGAAAAFRSSLKYHLMLGGDFVAHPAGEAYPKPYGVTISDRDHEVTEGVEDFDVASEQYYMQVDANVHVLAETEFDGEPFPWLKGRTSPVAWVTTWGEGNVFYHSIGHTADDLDDPNVRRLTKQGLVYAARA